MESSSAPTRDKSGKEAFYSLPGGPIQQQVFRTMPLLYVIHVLPAIGASHRLSQSITLRCCVVRSNWWVNFHSFWVVQIFQILRLQTDDEQACGLQSL